MPSNDKVLIEFGHNIVTKRQGFNPLTDKFEYIGGRCTEQRGFFLDSQLEQQDLGDVERLAGGEHLYNLAVNMYNLTTKGEGHRKDLPEATEAAKEGRSDALQLIQLYGFVVGKGAATMVISSKSDSKWPDHIVLGSTVGEKFAAGVAIPKDIQKQFVGFKSIEDSLDSVSTQAEKSM